MLFCSSRKGSTQLPAEHHEIAGRRSSGRSRAPAEADANRAILQAETPSLEASKNVNSTAPQFTR